MPEVRVIDTDGQQIGVMGIQPALRLAEEKGVDLVEVSPTAKPPVCRLMDFGKYMYQQSKKAKDARKKQHTTHLKEIKMRPRIDGHDYQFKLQHVRSFIEERNKVKVTVVFRRGRENLHREFGSRLLQRIAEDAADIATAEAPPRSEGLNMAVTLMPKSS